MSSFYRAPLVSRVKKGEGCCAISLLWCQTVLCIALSLCVKKSGASSQVWGKYPVLAILTNLQPLAAASAICTIVSRLRSESPSKSTTCSNNYSSCRFFIGSLTHRKDIKLIPKRHLVFIDDQHRDLFLWIERVDIFILFGRADLALHHLRCVGNTCVVCEYHCFSCVRGMCLMQEFHRI